MSNLRPNEMLSWTIILLAAIVVFWPASVATAQITKTWTGGSGDWSDGSKWSGGTAPGINDNAIIAPNDGTARTINFDSSSTLTALYVDLVGPGTAATTLSMPNDSSLNVHNFWVGGWNGAVPTTGRGVINQLTGIVSITPGAGPFDILDLGVYGGSTGTYNLGGGTLQASTNEYVGDVGTGIFNHTGGTNSISGIGHNLYIGGGPNNGVGTYTISNNGSTLATIGDVVVGNTSTGTGTLTIQNQASVDILNNLTINSHGTVNLNDGTLGFNGFTRAAGGTVNYTSGTVELAGNRDFSSDTALGTFFPGSTIPSGKKLVVEGNTTIQIAIESVDGGELVSQSALNVGSTFAGYLKVLNAGKAVATGSATLGLGAHGINIVNGAGSTLTVGGDLTIGSSDLTIQNQGLVYVGGAINFTTAVASDEIVLNGGTLRFSSYSNSQRLTYSAGTIQMAGDRTIGTDTTIAAFYGNSPSIPTGKQLTVEGTATIAATSQLTLTGGTLAADTVLMSPGSLILSTLPSQVNGAMLALAGSKIDATAANLALGDATKVNGFYSSGTLLVGQRTVTLADANDAVFDSAALISLGNAAIPGMLNAANGLTLDFGGNATGFGTISTPNNSAKPLINNGHITGSSVAQPITLSGYVKGVGTFSNVNFTGTFSPGFSPALISAGNLAFSPTSTLLIELGGTARGSAFDAIVASGSLGLAGALQLTLINGFNPGVGNSFDILDWGTISGTFSSLLLPSLGAGLTWNTSALYTSGVLSVAATAGVPGDYNNNGIVDAADFTIWRDHLGQSVALPNDTTPGSVTQADYDVWKSNFGNHSGSGSGTSATVPEPGSLLLLLSGTLAICSRRGQKNRKLINA